VWWLGRRLACANQFGGTRKPKMAEDSRWRSQGALISGRGQIDPIPKIAPLWTSHPERFSS
jgi:hypothetical protein